jgi:beta-N-acetylhexosaminidase
MALGATRSLELSEKAGYVLGRELRALGINLNFAPSVDVNLTPINPGIGIRSFGEDPHAVAEMGAAMIRGMQNEGLLACAKHFPGQGDVSSDTHHGDAISAHTLSRLEAVELLPFRRAIQQNVASILTTHTIFSGIDPEHPATLSRKVMQGLLREKMGFDGLTLTDAMDMYAVNQRGAQTSVQQALQAGLDLALLGHLPNQLQLAEQLASQEDEAAVARIQRVRESLSTHLPSMDVIGCVEHQQIAQQIADQSITLVRNADQIPLRLDSAQTIAVITPIPEDLTPADTSSMVRISLADALRKRHANVQDFQMARDADSEAIQAAISFANEADVVIVGTIDAVQDQGQVELIRTLIQNGQQPIVIALRTPYDLAKFPQVQTYLCAYGIRPVSMEATARVIFGEISPTGTLPCTIPNA